MAYKYMKTCLQLNQLLSQALSKQVEGSYEVTCQLVLEAKTALTDALKGLSQDQNIQLFVQIQSELCEMMATTGSPNPKKFLIGSIRRVSEALRKQSVGESFETLIMVNMELSDALVDNTQANLKSFLSVLSKAIMWLCDEDVDLFFELNDILSQVLATRSQDRRLDLIFQLNRFLSIFMSSDYPDSNTYPLIKLNHTAYLAIKEKLEKPTNLIMTNVLLSQQMKITSDGAFLQELIGLYANLSGIFLLKDMKIKYTQLIEWKLQLANVMQKFVSISNSKQKIEESTAENNPEKEISHTNDETSNGKERLSTLSDVLKKTIAERVVTVPEVGENASELRRKLSFSGQQYRDVQNGHTNKELIGEQKAKVQTEGENGTAAVVVEVPPTQPSVVEEKQGVAEEVIGFSKTRAIFLRSRKDFMTRMKMPPVKIRQKKTGIGKNPKTRESEDAISEGK